VGIQFFTSDKCVLYTAVTVFTFSRQQQTSGNIQAAILLQMEVSCALQCLEYMTLVTLML